MICRFQVRWQLAASMILCLLIINSGIIGLHAQGNTGSIHGTVTDQAGHSLQGVNVAVIPQSGEKRQMLSAADGKFDFTGVPAGSYTLEISAPGFNRVQLPVSMATGANQTIPVALKVASVSEEVVVEAEADNSIASELAPVKSLLDAASARTEISSNYVAEYTTPVTDMADIVQAAPGTVSFNSNGIGNGDAKIYYRGFVDGNYTTTWDGIPFQDSNDPTHHSWAYVPAAAIGHVDFDRSPGTASDIGTANFGGSIHFFSPAPSNEAHVRTEVTYGSWNTFQILGDITSGAFLHDKAHLWINGDYQSSDGYQTFAPKQNVAATAKFDYKFNDRNYLSVIATNIILDAFTNNDPTRRQLLHHGDNYLYDGTPLNPNGAPDPQYWRYSVYHVPSFFDIITFNHDFGKGWKLDTKSYAYGYSNHQHYQNKTDQDLVTDSILTATKTELVGGTDQSTWVAGATPTGIDKLNQYGRGGEIAALSYATRWGVFRTGSWYELTNTLRYQIYSDPLTWVDSPYLQDIKFHEHFYTHAVQPYAEFQFVAIPNLTVTAGIKDAWFRMNLTQYADGHTIFQLSCPTTASTLASACSATTQHAQDYNAILPSVQANYRLNSSASVFGQYGRGSIAPVSAVFDSLGAQTAVTPPPSIADTFQGGTVVKLNRVAFDADVYHIHYTNTYSTYTVPTSCGCANAGFTYNYANPNSNTIGVEAEGNVAVNHNLSFNANGTFGSAKYETFPGAAAVLNSNGVQITPALPATPTAWVALAAHDTESMGTTYQQNGLDFGIFGKRVGSRWGDISNFHQVIPLEPFWMSNMFLNYNVHSHNMFDGSKIKLSINNMFDDHSIVSNSAANDGTSLTSTTVVASQKVTASLQPYTPSWNDSIKKQAGRSIMISVQLGLTRHER